MHHPVRLTKPTYSGDMMNNALHLAHLSINELGLICSKMREEIGESSPRY